MSEELVDSKQGKTLEKLQDTVRTKSKLTREERIQKEKENLLDKLAATNLQDIRTRVAYILNHNPRTRNSDIALELDYWKTFQPEYLNHNGTVSQESHYKLERLTSIARARAKIQNEFGMFQPDEAVRTHRRGLEARQREEQLADKPEAPTIDFYVDESGTSGKYMVIGGLCISEGRDVFSLYRAMHKWIKDHNIRHEFHFTELSRGKLPAYLAFFRQAITAGSSMSFKAVALRQSNIRGRTREQIMYELYYQLVRQGIEHEVQTGRVVLPRRVNVSKDMEEGSDSLFIARIEPDLKTALSRQYGGQIILKSFESVDSKKNLFIQLGDLFIGSISRKLNKEDEAINPKDEFAEKALSMLRLTIDEDKAASQDFAYLSFI